VRASPREGPAAATALALVVLVIAWAGLYEGVRWPHLAALCAVAAVPAIAASSRRRRAPLVAVVAAVIAVPLVLAMSLRHSLWAYLSFDGEAWHDARAVLPDGLRTASHAGLPASFEEHPELVALLDLALAALAATIAWQLLVRRRPVAALLALGVGLAYRWTIEPPGAGAAAGALALAAVAAVLALAAWEGGSGERAAQRAVGAVALGGVAVLIAVGLGAGPVKAEEAWWAWKDWEVGGGGDPAAADLDLSQTYDGLDWPARPRVALTVSSESNLPLRAVALEDFDGVAFQLAGPSTGSTGERLARVENNAIELDPGPGSAGPELSQRVKLVGASSQVLLLSGRPHRVEGPFSGTARLAAGAVQLERPLEPGDGYMVRTTLPRPRAGELVEAGPYDPAAIPAASTRLRSRYGADPVDVPAWGSGDPGPDAAALGPYAQVRDLARRIVGDAASPYAAVNRVESQLRRRYAYDEAPPFPTMLPDGAASPDDRPPLVDFLMSSRRGYCQHFAGAMAVMLRSLGIPSRVAVGYGTGRYDSDRKAWVVLDRDAHSWVEVWFPGHGWLPFDPTPGRSAPNPASVSSPEYAPSRFEVDLGGIEDAAVAPPPEAPGPAEPSDEAQEQAPAPAGSSGGGGPPWQWALLALALPLAAIPGTRGALRARARRRGGERERVIAATRDLESSLRALGWAPPPAGAPSERAADVRDRTGVDPSSLYRRAAQARYAAAPLPAGAGAAAWREAGRLRRAIRRRATLGRRIRATFAIPPRRGTVAT
jgi:transglutaminase-like putative cysteine protease